MKDKIIFFTGATSGLGKVSAINAALKGATVLVLVRNEEKGQSLINEFKSKADSTSGEMKLLNGDLTSLKSVVSVCDKIKEDYSHLDILVNNAGIMNFEYKSSSDGIEETLQVNLLAPFLIWKELKSLLEKSKQPKVIFTASALHQGKINFNNIQFVQDFSSFKVYRQSKLGVILLNRLLAIQHPECYFYSQHPGIVNTELGRSAGWFSKLIFKWMGRTPEKGAETLTYLIEVDNSELVNGEYYADCKVKETTKEAYDLDMASRLKEVVEGYVQNYVSNNQILN